MRVARVLLHNVKSYAADTAVELAPGINAICGENGAGKSTILEAVGFALFGYRPYRLDAFLREGEKSGSITVTVEDDDGCPYHVVRKLGAGAGQAVYNELEQKIAEGEADVRNWLLGFFGLPAGTDLAKLFEDTVGPPQGTLTAIFLESTAPRKQKFDRLLGIEDYREASQGLRAVSSLFRDRAVEADRRAASLEGDARRVPEAEQRLLDLAQRKLALIDDLERLTEHQERLGGEQVRLEVARQAVQAASAALSVADGRARDARRRQEEQAVELRRAEESARLVAESRAGYQSHREAVTLLRQLEEKRKERDRLRQEAEAAGRNALRWEQGVRSLEERLAGLARDEARAAELDLRVPEQEDRERAVEQARERVRAREEAIRQLPAVQARLRGAQAALETARKQLAKVESVRPTAARLERLREQERTLRDELALLEKQDWELKQATEGLEAARGRLAQLGQELESLQGKMDGLLPLKPLAALAAARERARDAASGEVHALEARYQEAQRSRRQVEGGLCPFLHEPCRNLREGASLDAYFDSVLAASSAELEAARTALARAEVEAAEARSAEQTLARLPGLEQQAGRLAEERTRLEQEIGQREKLCAHLSAVPEGLARTREALRLLGQELVQAEAAQQIVAGEAGWRHQAEEATMAGERDGRILADLHSLLEAEVGAAEALEAARHALADLKDPRAEAAALRQRVARERPEAERALERGRREAAVARSAEEAGLRALHPFAQLEAEIAAATIRRDENEAAHRLFLANQADAERLPERQLAAQQAVAEAKQTEKAVEAARRQLEEVRAAYDEAEHLRLRQELERVAGDMGRAKGELEMCRDEEKRVVRELSDLQKAKAEMEVARLEGEEARRHMEAVEAVRRALDAAAPEIAVTLVRRVSNRATSLYRELLGQPALSLEWGSDYEIRSRVRAEEREFKQLSGGEQMAAALAVRLALLQTLSDLRIAFLDEPTAHMDAARRANLAAQIQNLRSFHQLVVISHDDSFDTLFGHVVRLAKKDGATAVEN